MGMSERGWMTRCILIVPSPANDQWVAAIERSLHRSGQSLELLRDHQSVCKSDNESQPVYLSFDPNLLFPAVGGERGLVLASAGTAVHSFGEDPDTAIIQTSILYAQYSCWNATRTVTEADLQRGSELRILDGLNIPPPDFSSWRFDPLTLRAWPAIMPYRDGSLCKGAKADWSTGVLTDKSRRNIQQDMLGPIDLTGAPRPLVGGPYYCLLPGIWKAEIEFRLMSVQSVDLRFEWGEPGSTVSIVTADLKAGRYSVELEREWNQIGAAEIVVELFSATIEGILVFDNITVERL